MDNACVSHNKVLIVEDEAKIREVLKAFLESKGFQAFCAENGEQAMALFDRENWALVLLDLMLPGLSGEQVCEKIRLKSRVPVIMLTAKVEEADQLRGLSLGADDYITKPFSLRLLSARVDALLRRVGQEPVPLYERAVFGEGELEIDFASHRVCKRKEPVNLTPNEFKILAALMKYPNKAFTREELIALALGGDFDGFDRTIDGYMKNIRQKIETNPKSPVYILTVHGVGYRFGGVQI